MRPRLVDSDMWTSNFSSENSNLHTLGMPSARCFFESPHVEFDKSADFSRSFCERRLSWPQAIASGDAGVGPAGVGLGGVTGGFFGRGRSGITL